MEPKHKIIVFLIVIFSVGAFYSLYNLYSEQVGSGDVPVASVSEESGEIRESVPQVSQNLPSEFPTDIPIEADARFEQNFTLDAEGQQQMTIVFPSKVSIKDNYTLYEEYLKDKNWSVANSYESEGVSSLYATRDTYEINVTISGDVATESQVSISVLKK